MMIKGLSFLFLIIPLSTASAVDYSEVMLGKLFTTPTERQSIDNSKRDDVPQERLDG